MCLDLSLLQCAFVYAVLLTQSSTTQFPTNIWKVGILSVRASHCGVITC